MRIYLGGLSPARSCGLPGDQMSRAGSFSCLTLHRMGVTWPSLLPETPVVSYTTFSPLLLRAVCLCGPIHDLTTIQGLPGILLYGVRTFLTIKRAHLADLSELRISEGEGNVKHWRMRIRVGAMQCKVSTCGITCPSSNQATQRSNNVLGPTGRLCTEDAGAIGRRGTARRARLLVWISCG